MVGVVVLGCADPSGDVDGGGVPAIDSGGGGDARVAADAEVATSDAAGEVDAEVVLPPLRDDGLVPAWTWIEEARRAMDSSSLEAAFAAEGWAPPPGTEIYAARIVAGVGMPAYVLYDAGGGAFSEDYWPASTVKVLSSLAALTFLHARGFDGAARVTWDSGFGDVAGAIVDRAIRVSSNQDYDRTIRIAGFDWLNETFLSAEQGFPGVVIQRSYAGFPIRDIPGMTIEQGGASDYVPARVTSADYGCGADGNCASLFELTEAVRRVTLDAEIDPSERFAIAPSDVDLVSDALCGATPSFFADGARRALGHDARICHKPGWVPWNDCLDHGLVEDPATGARYLLAVSTPETAGRTDCLALGEIAEHVLRALRDAGDPGMPLQLDAGVPIVVQLDDHGTDPATMRRDYTITVDAPGADRVEVHTDRWPIGSATGAGPRFAIDYAYAGGGERLLFVRAFAGTELVGARALRVAINPP